MRLLGRAASINVRKVLWTLDEIGLPCAHEPWGEGALSLSDPAFVALNPGRLVPVLVDGDLVLTESNTICRYLAAREGRSDLLPRDPRGRAEVERWMDWQASELNHAWRYAFMALVRRSPAFADAAQVAASVREWGRQLVLLETALERSGAFAAGAAFTLADIVLGLSVQRWFMTPVDGRPALPAIAAYHQRLSERPAFLRHGSNGLP